MMKYALVLSAVFMAATAGAVGLSGVFGNNMVLQRDRDVPVWGTGRPGERVQLDFGGQSVVGTVGADGKWQLMLKPMKADVRNRVLTVKGDNTLTLTNVLVGDVWLCVGQSNMEFHLNDAENGAEYARNAADNAIRLVRTPRGWSRTPSANAAVRWNICSSDSAGKFSAIGYLAGKEFRERLDIPIGLISVAWGGCRIEALCPAESFAESGASVGVRERFQRELYDMAARRDDELRKDKQRLPSVLFNAMVHPYTPMAVRGMFYYQGEDNHADGHTYAEKLKALAFSWCKHFRYPGMPIYVIQIAPWRYGNEDSTQLPRFWAAQQQFVREDSNAGFVVTTDCGNPDDIHPMDKATPAGRLAKLVLFREYGIGTDEAESPVPEKIEYRDREVVVIFRHADGLTTRDGKPVSHLQLAGADGVFRNACGDIQGERLTVTSAEVEKPKAIRFGWDKLANPNLINCLNVPVAPFSAVQGRNEE